MGRLGHWEILIIVLVAALLFGSRRLPELGRSLGKGLANFRESVKGDGMAADEPAVESVTENQPKER